MSNSAFTNLGTSSVLPTSAGGTGQTSYTNGQLLIGNTTGNTLTKATLTGTANQIVVTNGAGSITLSMPSTVSVNSLIVQNGVANNTSLNIKSGDYTSYSYVSKLILESGNGDLGYVYQNFIKCINTGSGGASNAQLIIGYTARGTPDTDTEVIRVNTAGVTVTGNISATTFNGVPITSSNVIGKNLLLNGDFQVSQSATSFSVAASSSPYTSDMWQIKTNANQQFTVTNLGGISGIKIQRNSGQTGTGQVLFGQTLTINQSYGAPNNKLTVTFTVSKGSNYSALSNSLACFVLYGTGSSDSSAINGTWSGSSETFVVALTSTATTYSFTLTSAMPSNATQIAMFFGFTPIGTAGADDSFTVSRVKLEYGSAYTGYNYLSYYETLQSVLPFHYRMTIPSGGYYATGMAYGLSSPVAFRAGIVLPSQMRNTPTVIFDTVSNYSIVRAGAGSNLINNPFSAITVSQANNNSVWLDCVYTNPAAVNGECVTMTTTPGQTSFIDFNCYLT